MMLHDLEGNGEAVQMEMLKVEAVQINVEAVQVKMMLKLEASQILGIRYIPLF